MGMSRNVRGYWITQLSVALMIWISGIDPARLNGQGATATISGRVTDMSDAAVAAADVQVKNSATGGVQTTASDEQGRYTLADLPVGEYDIHVSKSGFSNMVRTGVTLRGTKRVDFRSSGSNRDHNRASASFSRRHFQLDCRHPHR